MTRRQSRDGKKKRYKKKDKRKNNPYGKFTNRSFRDHRKSKTKTKK